jgi:hypothetical protein
MRQIDDHRADYHENPRWRQSATLETGAMLATAAGSTNRSQESAEREVHDKADAGVCGLFAAGDLGQFS